MKAEMDGEGVWGVPAISCELCRFYHHTEGTCIRRAPSPTYERIHTIMEQIFTAAGGSPKEFNEVYPGGAYWPSVEPSDVCGEFERGAGLGHMTFEEQEAAGFLKGYQNKGP